MFKIPADHSKIDDDPGVQQQLVSLLTSLMAGNPTFRMSAGAVVTSDTSIALPVVLKVSDFGPALNLAINAASLNGIAATNLQSPLTLGNLAVGESTAPTTLTFPTSAKPSAGSAKLDVEITHARSATPVKLSVTIGSW
jgi:hypothetical protein